jgi:hypothetical protein
VGAGAGIKLARRRAPLADRTPTKAARRTASLFLLRFPARSRWPDAPTPRAPSTTAEGAGGRYGAEVLLTAAARRTAARRAGYRVQGFTWTKGLERGDAVRASVVDYLRYIIYRRGISSISQTICLYNTTKYPPLTYTRPAVRTRKAGQFSDAFQMIQRDRWSSIADEGGGSNLRRAH